MIHIEIVGLERLARKLGPKLIGEPLRTFFKRASIVVQGEVRTRTPVDTGHLRNSIVYEVDKGALPLYAKIGPLNGKEGSPLYDKARAMEFGTATQGQPGVPHRDKHWPPPAALDVWARRHGFKDGAQVARIIGRRGGLKPRKFMQDGFKASVGQIKSLIGRLGDDVRSAWNRRG